MSRSITITVASALAVTTMLSGCTTVQKKPLEALGVVSAVGYDAAKEDKLLGTLVIPNFTETGKEKIDVLTGTGHTTNELRYNLSRLSERQLVSGQIRVVIYGEALAKQGIGPLSDTLFRDAEIGSQIHLAVCEGRSVEILTHRYPDKPSVDVYLYKMLRKEMDQNSIPKSNLHLFVRHVYDKGSDAVLPYLKLGKEDVIVDGVALFRDDVYVGHLNLDDARVLSYLMGGRSNGIIDEVVPGKTLHGDPAHVVVNYLKMKRHIEAGQQQGVPQFNIKLSIDGAVTEYTGSDDLEKPDQVEKLDKTLEKQMQSKMESLIKRLQTEYNCDSLGLGEIYRSKGFVKKLNREEWKKTYKTAKISVDVDFHILQTGMIH